MARASHKGNSGVAGADQTRFGVFKPSEVLVIETTRERTSFSFDAMVPRV